MSKQSTETLLAAELADHFIEVILSNKPELLVSGIGGVADLHHIQHGAKALAHFRLTLIQELSQQPCPTWAAAEATLGQPPCRTRSRSPCEIRAIPTTPQDS